MRSLDCDAQQPGSYDKLRRRSSIEAPYASLSDSLPAAAPTTPKKPQLQRQSSIDAIEMASCQLRPLVEGRIVVIDEKTLPQLMDARHKWETSCPIQESVE